MRFLRNAAFPETDAERSGALRRSTFGVRLRIGLFALPDTGDQTVSHFFLILPVSRKSLLQHLLFIPNPFDDDGDVAQHDKEGKDGTQG